MALTEKARHRQYTMETTTDADSTDYIKLLANTPAKLNPYYIVWGKQQEALASM